MAPGVTSWEDLAFLREDFHQETGGFRRTAFAVVAEDDTAYFGRSLHRKQDLTFEELKFALAPIPDEAIFPEWAPSDVELTRAPDTLPLDTFIKRPNLRLYDGARGPNTPIINGILEEAEAMEMLSKHPHPNIIRYHGCHVRRGRITGVVLDRCPNTLASHIENGAGLRDKQAFMHALESAIRHLHSLDWAHNGLNPDAVLVDEAGMPVLINFASAREIGTGTSDHLQDLLALQKLRVWLDAPTLKFSNDVLPTTAAESAGCEPYQYAPLEEGDIRVLTILPSQDPASQITCGLSRVSLEAAVAEGFTALSYTWGPPTQPQHAIAVDGRTLTVGEQLHRALVSLRSSSEPLRLWVDAVCICQSDLGEKDVQLPLMRYIYGRARRVEIWLGPDEDDTGFAIRTIAAGDLAAQSGIRYLWALATLLSRPWFTRVWVVQEVALAQPGAPWARSGSESAPWDDFAAASERAVDLIAREIKTTDQGFAYNPDRVDVGAVLVGARSRSAFPFTRNIRQGVAAKNFTLTQAVIGSVSSRATDPRDKVYGLLGLIPEAFTKFLAPSYEKPVWRVYAEATIAAVLVPGSFRMYYYLPTDFPSDGLGPSWALDFSYVNYVFAQNSFADQSVREPPTLDGQIQTELISWGSRQGLRVRGTVVDIISDVCANDILFSDGGDQRLGTLLPFMARAGTLHRAAESTAGSWAPNGIEPLWRTLVAHRTMDWDISGFSPDDMRLKQDLLTGAGRDVPVSALSDPAERRQTAQSAQPLAWIVGQAMAASNRRSRKTFFTTAMGLCGQCVGAPQPGDAAAVLFRDSAHEVAFVLREEPEGGAYRVVGVAHLSKDWVKLCEYKGTLEPENVVLV